jgi:hypothetical protein
MALLLLLAVVLQAGEAGLVSLGTPTLVARALDVVTLWAVLPAVAVAPLWGRGVLALLGSAGWLGTLAFALLVLLLAAWPAGARWSARSARTSSTSITHAAFSRWR